MMKTIAYVALVLLCLGISSIAFAEETKESEKANNAVGLTMGWVVANGLSYRQYFGKNFVQGTFAGLIDKEADEAYLDMSFSYARFLNQFEMNRRFSPMGLKLVMGVEAEHDKSKDLLAASAITTNYVHSGVGIGLDIGNPGTRGIVVEFNIIYTASFKGFSSLDFTKLELRPSGGIHYNF